MYIFTIVFIFLAGCSADGGKVSARDVLKKNDDADVLKYNGFMYNNVTELDWFKEHIDEILKGEKIGEIKKVSTSSLFFSNFTATKLPKGTVLYDSNDGDTGMIIAESESGEFLYYMQLLEG
jgi:hypothetical protein